MQKSLSYIFYRVTLAGVSCHRCWPLTTTFPLQRYWAMWSQQVCYIGLAFEGSLVEISVLRPVFMSCLQCFDSVGWVAERASGLYKTERWGTGIVICVKRCADLHMAQLIPLPLTVSCSSKIQIGFTFLVPALLGSPRQRAIKRVCVCVPMFMSIKRYTQSS